MIEEQRKAEKDKKFGAALAEKVLRIVAPSSSRAPEDNLTYDEHFALQENFQYDSDERKKQQEKASRRLAQKMMSKERAKAFKQQRGKISKQKPSTQLIVRPTEKGNTLTSYPLIETLLSELDIVKTSTASIITTLAENQLNVNAIGNGVAYVQDQAEVIDTHVMEVCHHLCFEIAGTHEVASTNHEVIQEVLKNLEELKQNQEELKTKVTKIETSQENISKEIKEIKENMKTTYAKMDKIMKLIEELSTSHKEYMKKKKKQIWSEESQS